MTKSQRLKTVVRVIDSEDFSDVNMQATAAGEITFEPVRTTATARNIELRTPQYTARIELTSVGGLSICSPSGARKLGRYPDC